MRPVTTTIKVLLAAAIALTLRTAGAEAPFWPSWSTTALPAANSMVQSGANPDVILLVRGSSDPVRSLDGGATFASFTVLGIQPQVIVPAPRSDVFYAMSAQPRIGDTPAPQLYRSDDAGATWRQVAPAAGAGGWIGNITVDMNPDVLYGTRMEESSCFTGFCGYAGAEPFRSIDGGHTWQSIGSAVTGHDVILQAAISSNGRVLYAANNNGIFRTLNSGATWDYVHNVSLDTGQVGEIAVDQVDPSTAYVRLSLYPTNGAQVLVTDDAGETWRMAAVPDAPGTGASYVHLITDPVQAGRVFFVGDEGHVFESTDRARTWKRVAGAGGILSQNSLSLSADGDNRSILASDGSFVRRVEIHPDSYVLGSDLWWNPMQSGRGMTITQHADGKVFVAWYAYDTQGQQVWRVIPEGAWQDAKTLTGSIYETRGPFYFQGAFDPARVSVAMVGDATLAFDSDSRATFTYRLNEGNDGTIPIVRESFGTPHGTRMGGYGDLWWNPNESGWGVAVNQQYDKVFAAWYVYDATGRPQWLVLPDSTFSLTAQGTGFSGPIYVTSGPPSTGVFDPRSVTVTPVGTATLLFPDRANGTLTYTAFGQTATRQISRQPF
jgi:photosystem II stability/assembly factor-like uncharacterized protein